MVVKSLKVECATVPTLYSTSISYVCLDSGCCKVKKGGGVSPWHVQREEYTWNLSRRFKKVQWHICTRCTCAQPALETYTSVGALLCMAQHLVFRDRQAYFFPAWSLETVHLRCFTIICAWKKMHRVWSSHFSHANTNVSCLHSLNLSIFSPLSWHLCPQGV